jgi:hypothetical protein
MTHHGLLSAADFLTLVTAATLPTPSRSRLASTGVLS